MLKYIVTGEALVLESKSETLEGEQITSMWIEWTYLKPHLKKEHSKTFA